MKVKRCDMLLSHFQVDCLWSTSSAESDKKWKKVKENEKKWKEVKKRMKVKKFKDAAITFSCRLVMINKKWKKVKKNEKKWKEVKQSGWE
jgi:hypothetical protein